MPEIVTPDISWITSAPDLVLAVGAAVVLLVEVQWKPRSSTLGWVAGYTIVFALGLTILQFALFETATSVGDLVSFSGMITMDGFGVFARLVLILAAGLGLAGGWGFIKDQGAQWADERPQNNRATADKPAQRNHQEKGEHQNQEKLTKTEKSISASQSEEADAQ